MAQGELVHLLPPLHGSGEDSKEEALRRQDGLSRELANVKAQLQPQESSVSSLIRQHRASVLCYLGIDIARQSVTSFYTYPNITSVMEAIASVKLNDADSLCSEHKSMSLDDDNIAIIGDNYKECINSVTALLDKEFISEYKAIDELKDEKANGTIEKLKHCDLIVCKSDSASSTVVSIDRGPVRADITCCTNINEDVVLSLARLLAKGVELRSYNTLLLSQDQVLM